MLSRVNLVINHMIGYKKYLHQHPHAGTSQSQELAVVHFFQLGRQSIPPPSSMAQSHHSDVSASQPLQAYRQSNSAQQATL